jgi:hypothetical protein
MQKRSERRRVGVPDRLLDAEHEPRDSILRLRTQGIRREDTQRQAQKEGANSHERY